MHTVNVANSKTMEELYQATLEKENFLKTKVSFTYVNGNASSTEIKENISIQSFINELNLITPLEPRDAFFG